MEIGAVPTDAGAAFNYGLTRCASLRRSRQAPECGCASRLSMLSREEAACVLKMSNTLEIEGSNKPALVAELLALITPRKSV